VVCNTPPAAGVFGARGGAVLVLYIFLVLACFGAK